MENMAQRWSLGLSGGVWVFQGIDRSKSTAPNPGQMRYSKGHQKGTQIQAAKDLISRREAAGLEPQEKYW